MKYYLIFEITDDKAGEVGHHWHRLLEEHGGQTLAGGVSLLPLLGHIGQCNVVLEIQFYWKKLLKTKIQVINKHVFLY